MSYRYDVAVAFRLDHWNDKILPKIIEEGYADKIYEDKRVEYKNPVDGWDYILLEWDNYKNWAGIFVDDISSLIDKMTKEYPCDYIVIGEGQDIEKENYDFSILNYQSMRPLLPDDLYLEKAWRAINNLKSYLKNNYNLQDDQINYIIKGKV